MKDCVKKFKKAFEEVFFWSAYFDKNSFLGEYGSVSEYHKTLAEQHLEYFKSVPIKTLQRISFHLNHDLESLYSFEEILANIKRKDFNVYFHIYNNENGESYLLKVREERKEWISYSFLEDIQQRISLEEPYNFVIQ